MLYSDQEDKFKLNSDQKSFRAFMLAGGTAGAVTIASSPVHAQSAPISVDSVNTQLQSAQTGVLALGAALIGMALGITLFLIGKKIMKSTTQR